MLSLLAIKMNLHRIIIIEKQFYTLVLSGDCVYIKYNLCILMSQHIFLL